MSNDVQKGIPNSTGDEFWRKGKKAERILVARSMPECRVPERSEVHRQIQSRLQVSPPTTYLRLGGRRRASHNE